MAEALSCLSSLPHPPHFLLLLAPGPEAVEEMQEAQVLDGPRREPNAVPPSSSSSSSIPPFSPTSSSSRYMKCFDSEFKQKLIAALPYHD